MDDSWKCFFLFSSNTLVSIQHVVEIFFLMNTVQLYKYSIQSSSKKEIFWLDWWEQWLNQIQYKCCTFSQVIDTNGVKRRCLRRLLSTDVCVLKSILSHAHKNLRRWIDDSLIEDTLLLTIKRNFNNELMIPVNRRYSVSNRRPRCLSPIVTLLREVMFWCDLKEAAIRAACDADWLGRQEVRFLSKTKVFEKRQLDMRAKERPSTISYDPKTVFHIVTAVEA